MFGGSVLDMSDFPSRHPYTLAIWQNQIERIMADWIAELPVQIHYGREVTGFAQDEAGVEVQLADGDSLRGQYLVGCDGGRSLIRRAAGVEFPGWEPTRSNIIAEVEMTDGPPDQELRHDATGVHAIRRMEDGKTFRIVVTERQVGASTEPTVGDLSKFPGSESYGETRAADGEAPKLTRDAALPAWAPAYESLHPHFRQPDGNSLARGYQR
jgi:2-polyprenyl-6-methoxyphenol hydroxylase-like FAD-dependent oxidoreductase